MVERLLSIGILLEASTSPEVVAARAVLAERAGLDSLWLAGTGGDGAVQDSERPLAALAAAASRTSRIALGAYLRHSLDPPDVPGQLASRLQVTAGRGELRRAHVVELGASVGRTTAEAQARIDQDPRLRGPRDPRNGGLFGTLDDCQARVAELAREGVVELRCWIPDTPDIHDVIAQLAAAAVGTLVPSARGRQSQPPSAPKGWGGRPRRPAGPPLS